MLILVSCALVALGCQLVVAVRKPSYLITTPNRFIQNRPETVCIDLHNVQKATQVNLTLSTVWIPRSWRPLPKGARNQTLDSATVQISPTEKTKCVTLTLPTILTAIYPDKLRIDARGAPVKATHKGFRFSDTMFVAIFNQWYRSDLLFIQTDKPIYKPGQIVKIRILSLDTRLRPSNDTIESVAIETPSHARIEQWSNLTNSRGLLQLEFRLHPEPEIGSYTIRTSKKYGRARQDRFEVKDYVLPKYKVTLEPPAHVTFQTERIVAKVCAWYTFGKPVRGVASASICVKEQSRTFSAKKTASCTSVEETLVDGCYTINVTRADVGYDRYKAWQWGVRLEIAARVKEQGTGVHLNASTRTIYFEGFDMKLSLEGPKKFKPGLPFNGKVVAQRLDGRPAISEPIEIIVNNWGLAGQYSKIYTTDVNGEVSFSVVLPARFIDRYSIRAQATSFNSSFWSWNSPSAYLYVEGWYSPSGSFLQIIPKTETLLCGSEATFKIEYTTSIALNTQLHYQVVGLTDIANSGKAALSLNLNTRVAQPNIHDIWNHTQRESCYSGWNCQLKDEEILPTNDTTTPTNSIPKKKTGRVVTATHKGTVSLTVPITADMSSRGKLVVFYIRPNGEVVADGIGFKIEECTANKVSMTFSKSQGRPGDPVDIRFRASANSLCSYGIVDKSVFSQGGNHHPSLSEVLSQLQDFDIGERSGLYVSDTERCGPTPYSKEFLFYWTVSYKDASGGFRTAGLSTMTNLDIYTTPCKLNKFRIHREPVRRASSSDDAPKAAILTRNGTAAINSAGLSVDGFGYEPAQAVDAYIPESWLWDLATTDATGAASVSSTLPDTITEWVGNAVCMSDVDGIGISPPASIIGFQPFFVSTNLPYSVIRTEKVPIAVTVSNYLSKCMAVSLKTNSSSEYDIDGSSTGVSCVCGQNSTTRIFTIIMKAVGNVNVSITAEVVNDSSVCPNGSVMSSQVGMSDTVIRPVLVEPEGAPREYTVSDFVCMTRPDSASKSGTALESYKLPLPGPSELVLGSERAYVKVVGDVMGVSLLKRPYGCAEQTMVSFAPNLFVMKYLEAINKDKPDLRSKAIRYMKSGYERELRYAHNDHSYSSFGTSKPGTPGSMWLTAFVVKCFGLAQPYIYIDKSIMTKSILFFTKYQDKDGCFPQIGTVHNKYMQGGIGQSANGTNKAGLTAFVAIAMMEAGVESTDRSIVNAFQCIHRQTYSDAYTASIVAYAYSIFDKTDSRAVAAYQRLMNMAVVNGTLTMWNANISKPFSPRISSHNDRPQSADIETTAYALLTKLNMVSDTNTKISKGLPIVRWLSTQRNPSDGFGSTQATVIGLQALAEYAALIYSDGLWASIRISENVSNTQVASFELNNGNSFVEFTATLPRVTDLKLMSTGKGCFLVQTYVRYNVKKVSTDKQHFQATANVYRGSKKACKSRKLKICTSYTGGGVRNIVILEAKMVSGWVADVTTLKALVADKSVGVHQYQLDKNGAVQLYLSSLERTEKCVTLDIHQKFDVKEAKPALITVYDYHKTELRQELEYQIDACVKGLKKFSLMN